MAKTKKSIDTPDLGEPVISASVEIKEPAREIKQPKIIQTAKHLAPEENISLKPGMVYVVSLDSNGNERPGSGFITSKRTYDKSYDKNKFKIKKKA